MTYYSEQLIIDDHNEEYFPQMNYFMVPRQAGCSLQGLAWDQRLTLYQLGRDNFYHCDSISHDKA